jgi:hypothetical protein
VWVCARVCMCAHADAHLCVNVCVYAYVCMPGCVAYVCRMISAPKLSNLCRRVMQQAILDANGSEGKKAWAFGLGLERLAMVLFGIPDIRLFWSSDQRFLKQFKAGNLAARFKTFSKFPPCFKVVSPPSMTFDIPARFKTVNKFPCCLNVRPSSWQSAVRSQWGFNADQRVLPCSHES